MSQKLLIDLSFSTSEQFYLGIWSQTLRLHFPAFSLAKSGQPMAHYRNGVYVLLLCLHPIPISHLVPGTGTGYETISDLMDFGSGLGFSNNIPCSQRNVNQGGYVGQSHHPSSGASTF